MADPIGDFVVTAKDYRRKSYLDGVFTSHPTGMPTEGDTQTPSLTQQPQAVSQEHAAVAAPPKAQPAPAQQPVAQPRATREVQPAGVVGSPEHAAQQKAELNQQSLDASMKKNDQNDKFTGREFLRPTDNPIEALGNTAELTSMPGRAGVVKATGRDVGDPTKFDTAAFLKKLNIPTLNDLNPDAPGYHTAAAMATMLGLGLGVVTDPTNFIGGGGGGPAKLGKYAKGLEEINKLPKHTPNPLPSYGLKPEQVAAESHAEFIKNQGEGVTWNPAQGNMDGKPAFAVSPQIVPEKTIPGVATRQDFHDFVKENEKWLAQYPDLSVGAWKENGNTVFDLVATVEDYKKARELGYLSRQRAMWDLQNRKLVDLPKLELEHYGKPGQALEGGEIKPSMQGTGQAGGEAARRSNYGQDYVERSFFYQKGTKPEDRFKGHPKYTAEVDPTRIYDMSADPEGFAQKEKDFTLREKAIKEAGYLGYTHPDAYAGDKTMSRVVQLFENVTPKETGLPELDRRLAFLEETAPAIDKAEDVGTSYADPTIGPRGKGVRNNVVVNAGAAVIHRGAKTLEQFVQGMEQTGVIHAAGAEVNWEKLYDRAKKTYGRYVDDLASTRNSTLTPIRELSKMFKKGEYLKTWYNDAPQAAIDAVGAGIDKGTGLPDNLLLLKFVAATSPQQAVEPNIKLALTAYKNYKLGEPWASELKFNEVNLNRVADNIPFTYDEGGIKVTDFYDALSGNPKAFTVDSHMMGAYGFSRTVKHPELGSDSVEYFASPRQIGFMKSLGEQEAARFKVDPREYQAAVWVGRKFKIGLQPGEKDPDTFGNILNSTLRQVAEKDPYFKYPDGMNEEGKANFATMWMLTRIAGGLLFGGSYGDTPRERLSNAIVGAGVSLAAFSPKTLNVLTGIMKKSEAAIAMEKEASRAETVFKLSGAGNDIRVVIGKSPMGLNAARLQTPDGLQYAVEKVMRARKESGLGAEGVREGSRGVIPNEEARRLGKLLGLDQNDVLSRLAGTPHAAEEVFAYADILQGAWDHLQVMAREVQIDPTAANKSALQMFVPTYRSIGNQLLGTGEEAGRALQAHGAADVLKAKSQFKSSQGALDLIQHAPQIPIENLAKVLTSIDAGTFSSISRQADTLGWDMFNEMLYFNLLSNPTTHVVNVLGSSVLAPAVSVATRATAALTKYTHGGMSADEMMKDPLNAPVTLGEVKQSIVGYLNGWGMARKAIVDSWHATEGTSILEKLDNLRDVKSDLGGASKFDQTRAPGITSQNLGTAGVPYLGALTDGAGSLIRSTSTALKLGDLISSNINYSMEVYSLAYRKSTAMGLTGDAFDAEFARQLANPDPEVKAAAKEFAAIQTFTNVLDGRLASMQDMLSHPLTKTIAPFIGTPTNIFRYNLSYLPGLNMALKGAREDIQAGGARADIVRAKMALGTALITSLFAAAANDQITGSGPAEKSQRALWMTDHQPNSVKIGKNWYGLNRFDPVIGSYVGLSADLYQMMDDMPEAKISEMGVMLAASFFRNFTSKTWSESAFEFTDLLHVGRSETTEDMMKAFENFARSHAKLAVPGAQGMGAVNQAFFDDTIHEVTNWKEAMQAQVPGWSKYLKPNLDYFGNPVKKNNLGPDLLSPINVKTGKPDPVVTEIRKQRVELPTIPKVIGGQPLTGDEVYDFKTAFAKDAKIDGLNLHDFLEDMITKKDSAYWDLPQDAGPNPLSHRSEFLKQIVSQFMDQAKEIMADKYENPKFLRIAQDIKKAKARGEDTHEEDIKSDLRSRRQDRGIELSIP